MSIRSVLPADRANCPSQSPFPLLDAWREGRLSPELVKSNFNFLLQELVTLSSQDSRSAEAIFTSIAALIREDLHWRDQLILTLPSWIHQKTLNLVAVLIENESQTRNLLTLLPQWERAVTPQDKQFVLYMIVKAHAPLAKELLTVILHQKNVFSLALQQHRELFVFILACYPEWLPETLQGIDHWKMTVHQKGLILKMLIRHPLAHRILLEHSPVWVPKIPQALAVFEAICTPLEFTAEPLLDTLNIWMPLFAHPERYDLLTAVIHRRFECAKRVIATMPQWKGYLIEEDQVQILAFALDRYDKMREYMVLSASCWMPHLAIDARFQLLQQIGMRASGRGADQIIADAWISERSECTLWTDYLPQTQRSRLLGEVICHHPRLVSQFMSSLQIGNPYLLPSDVYHVLSGLIASKMALKWIVDTAPQWLAKLEREEERAELLKKLCCTDTSTQLLNQIFQWHEAVSLETVETCLRASRVPATALVDLLVPLLSTVPSSPERKILLAFIFQRVLQSPQLVLFCEILCNAGKIDVQTCLGAMLASLQLEGMAHFIAFFREHRARLLDLLKAHRCLRLEFMEATCQMHFPKEVIEELDIFTVVSDVSHADLLNNPSYFQAFINFCTKYSYSQLMVHKCLQLAVFQRLLTSSWVSVPFLQYLINTLRDALVPTFPYMALVSALRPALAFQRRPEEFTQGTGWNPEALKNARFFALPAVGASIRYADGMREFLERFQREGMFSDAFEAEQLIALGRMLDDPMLILPDRWKPKVEQVHALKQILDHCFAIAKTPEAMEVLGPIFPYLQETLPACDSGKNEAILAIHMALIAHYNPRWCGLVSYVEHRLASFKEEIIQQCAERSAMRYFIHFRNENEGEITYRDAHGQGIARAVLAPYIGAAYLSPLDAHYAAPLRYRKAAYMTLETSCTPKKFAFALKQYVFESTARIEEFRTLVETHLRDQGAPEDRWLQIFYGMGREELTQYSGVLNDLFKEKIDMLEIIRICGFLHHPV